MNKNIILEFSKFNQFNVISVDDIPVEDINRMIERKRYFFGEEDFMVLVEYNGVEKEIALPHDVFIEYIEESDPGLSKYLDSGGVSDIDSIFYELQSFGWDFETNIRNYFNEKVSLKSFEEMEDMRDYNDF